MNTATKLRLLKAVSKDEYQGISASKSGRVFEENRIFLRSKNIKALILSQEGDC